MNNVLIDSSSYLSALVKLQISPNLNNTSVLLSSTPLVTNQWQHVATVLNSTSILIYINGLVQGQANVNVRPDWVMRNNCYIGASNFGTPNAISVLDDLKIYQRALSQAEIQAEMNL
jgi:hypothetical protein